MNRLVAAVMLATIGAIIAQIVRGDRPPWVGWVSLVLAGAAILLAALRTVPAAVRLGARTDSSRHQSELAESIGRDHVSAPPRSSPLSQSSCRSPDDPSPAHAFAPERVWLAWKAAAGLALQGAVTRKGSVDGEVRPGREGRAGDRRCARHRLRHGPRARRARRVRGGRRPRRRSSAGGGRTVARLARDRAGRRCG